MKRIGSGVVDMVSGHSCYLLRPSLFHLYTGSDIVYTHVLGQSIVVIDKYKTAVEILDKRSGIYSSRCVYFTPYSLRGTRPIYRVDLYLRCLNSYLAGVMFLVSYPMVM
jgi:hypothetical protein